MSSVVIAGDTSGSVTLQAPATAGSVVVTLPAASGTMAVSGASPSFTTITTTNDALISGLTVGKGGGAVASNTALGYVALATNSSGLRQTAVGHYALNATTTGTDNTAVGQYALGTNSTGGYNTALGVQSLNSNTTASYNTAVGYQAGYSTTTQSGSTYIGYQASYNNSNIGNTAVGNSALYGAAASTGAYNTAIGHQTLQSINGSNNNTAVGYQAGFGITTGANNTFLGINAGYAGSFGLATGSNCIGIGYYPSNSSTSVNHELIIGTNQITGKGANTGFISANSGSIYQGNNSSSWATTSDQRLKKNIVDNTEGLEIISQIRVRNFEYRLPEEVTELDPSCAINRTGIQLGVIAQELREVCPDCVKEESTGVISVDSDNIFWHMVNAIKELNAKVTALEAQLAGAK